ncbi:protocatechuate 3,4-dioxygenase subunit beta [Halotalea alkalilenta]|uniref:protocatechuate 3,4-dioxygenase subunit beta n=1 Tax=Halotalea alkalilenta TaxID=376489 RepID=UPI000AEE1638|nr:protocatechuate 3,4-dioxygenase subunit beta [Halotalea alkalilenta]
MTIDLGRHGIRESDDPTIPGDYVSPVTGYETNSLIENPANLHQPPMVFDPYQSTRLRGPRNKLVPVASSRTERTAPVYGFHNIGRMDNDLTIQHDGQPLGEKIVIVGQVRNDAGQPLPNTLIEIWQANASGRYIHKKDQHPAPLDPNFTGAGRTFTDENGYYKFITIRPGPYPWGNHHDAWRPAHIHFSLLGRAFHQRLVTQMYFPGDQLLEIDPIYMANPSARARDLLIARFDRRFDVPGIALGYRFDIVIGSPRATPFE